VETVIETTGLTKFYHEIKAVEDLTLSIRKGEVYGFLGPNGAGKSTTILMLLGLTEPTAGRASVLGLDPSRSGREIKKSVGCMPENVGFYDDMTGRENLKYIARLNDIPEQMANIRIETLLETVNLSESADRLAGEYSRGMRQRLGIAEVMVKDPQLVILDEPTLGLDPEGIGSMLEFIKKLSTERGITILLCSHLLQQVQTICDRVGILDQGRLVAEGRIEDLAGGYLRGEEGQLSLEEVYLRHFKGKEA